jgi:hypothetical protein
MAVEKKCGDRKCTKLWEDSGRGGRGRGERGRGRRRGRGEGRARIYVWRAGVHDSALGEKPGGRKPGRDYK